MLCGRWRQTRTKQRCIGKWPFWFCLLLSGTSSFQQERRNLQLVIHTKVTGRVGGRLPGAIAAALLQHIQHHVEAPLEHAYRTHNQPLLKLSCLQPGFRPRKGPLSTRYTRHNSNGCCQLLRAMYIHQAAQRPNQQALKQAVLYCSHDCFPLLDSTHAFLFAADSLATTTRCTLTRQSAAGWATRSPSCMAWPPWA
jgi:hypothetical protein